MNKKIYFVYILSCNNGAYYTGYTTDLVRRFREHVLGTAKCKFTRSFKPIKIAQSWRTNSKTKALKIENFIKKLTRIEKQQLVQYPRTLRKKFSSSTKGATNG